jgi:lactate dehydrogenase-like 2-hydroxyacid dehydrogenase
MHHEIVALERVSQPLPDAFDFPTDTTYTLTTYDQTPTKALLHERVRHATIILVTTVKLSAETLSSHVTPNLRLVAVMATGTDCVDLEACNQRGIRVTNSPAANLDAVSEHAISLYFAARRRTVLLDRLTKEVPSLWKRNGSLNKYMRYADEKPPLTCKDEVLGIVGYGALGTPFIWFDKRKADVACRAENSGFRARFRNASPHRRTQKPIHAFISRSPRFQGNPRVL